MSIGRQFMLETQYSFMPPSAQSQGEPQPPLELPYDSSQRTIELPPPDALALKPVDLREIIGQRRTVRNYAAEPLSIAELSHLLWCTQGVQDVRGSYATVRTVPSAGARHAFETYLLVNAVDDVEHGVYRYLASAHQLIRLPLGEELTRRITQGCLNQEQVARSAVTFMWVAVVERMHWRYGERGYRYMLLDAGHVCQNLYLAAQVIGCGVCAIAAYDDVALNRELELDGEEMFVIYVASLGKKR
jgi:SagB-type dehydrogenase family enzyme